MIVADASVILDVLIRTPGCERLDDLIFDGRETLHAPHLLDLEVAQVLRRYVSRNEISSEHGNTAIELLSRFPIKRYPHEPLLGRVWSLRANLTAYDAAYVALAEGLGARLLTRDKRLAVAPGSRARIEVV